MNDGLWGKVAIVTGAGGGIGRATSILFAKEGVKVVDSDVNAHVAETARIINDTGGSATAIIGDAGREADVRSLVAAATEQYGGLDIFFANAGVAGNSDFGIFDSTAEDWLEVLRVNLVGPFLAVKYGAPALHKRGGGSIICTSSVAGLRAGAGPASYSASKAGVINLVQSACHSLAGTNIRVNAICPGLIATKMTEHWYDETGAAAKQLTDLIPQRRGGVVEEIADAALFLASDASRYINGQHIIVDGGLSASIPSAWHMSAEQALSMLQAAQ